MNQQETLSGVIVSGVGQAAYFTGLDWVRKQCAEKLHFEPYPGTLNIRVDENCLGLLAAWQQLPAIELPSPDPAFCNARTLPAFLSNLRVAILIPEESVNIHGRHILELIAPVNLKETLSLRDGDRVVLTLTP